MSIKAHFFFFSEGVTSPMRADYKLNFTSKIAKIQELPGVPLPGPMPGPTRGHKAAPDPMPLKKIHAVPALTIGMLIACITVET